MTASRSRCVWQPRQPSPPPSARMPTLRRDAGFSQDSGSPCAQFRTLLAIRRPDPQTAAADTMLCARRFRVGHCPSIPSMKSYGAKPTLPVCGLMYCSRCGSMAAIRASETRSGASARTSALTHAFWNRKCSAQALTLGAVSVLLLWARNVDAETADSRTAETLRTATSGALVTMARILRSRRT